jgi:hypothetical protein
MRGKGVKVSGESLDLAPRRQPKSLFDSRSDGRCAESCSRGSKNVIIDFHEALRHRQSIYH